MDGSRDDVEFLVADDGAPVFASFEGIWDGGLLTCHCLESPLAEVAAVSLLAVDEQHGVRNLVGIAEQVLVEERLTAADIPAVIRSAAALMIATRSGIVVAVLLDKLRNLVGHLFLGQHTAATLIIQGLEKGTDINIYNTAGQLAGSAKATVGITTINTTLKSGEVGIVKINDKAIKIMMK